MRTPKPPKRLPSAGTVLQRAVNLLFRGTYWPTEYFVFPDRRVVYLSVPKVACTSIKLALDGSLETLCSTEEGVMGVHERLEAGRVHSLGRRHADYTLIAFVRNPFDRLVSCYEDKVRRPLQHDGRYFFAGPYNRLLLRKWRGAEFHPDMSFHEFVSLVARIPDRMAEGHFKSQASMLHAGGARRPDFVGRFERLEADWTMLADRLGLPELTLSNPTRHTDWREYYRSGETIELATERYRLDLDEFGYSLESNDRD
jgi:Sulfotransferase family